MTAALSDSATVRGTVQVRDRAYEKVMREVAHSVIGVPRTDISVQVRPRAQRLVLHVCAPLPIVNLHDTAAVQAATPLLSRIRELQTQLADRAGHLTGRDIERVSFTVTGAILPQRKRVN